MRGPGSDSERARSRSARPAGSGTDRVRALCCRCGQLRTVSGRRRPADFLGDLRDRAERMVGTYKCVHCGTPTRHAILRDDAAAWAADGAEDRDHARPIRLPHDVASRLLQERVTMLGAVGVAVHLVQPSVAAGGTGPVGELCQDLSDGQWSLILIDDGSPTELLAAIDHATELMADPDRHRETWTTQVGHEMCGNIGPLRWTTLWAGSSGFG